MTDMPTDIRDALARDAEAARAFERLPPSRQPEYLCWMREAKESKMRLKRIGSIMERLSAPRGA
jgi:uncharacterized protein YdeI (YjbR/CyaY-like superfamily)